MGRLSILWLGRCGVGSKFDGREGGRERERENQKRLIEGFFVPCA